MDERDRERKRKMIKIRQKFYAKALNSGLVLNFLQAIMEGFFVFKMIYFTI